MAHSRSQDFKVEQILHSSLVTCCAGKQWQVRERGREGERERELGPGPIFDALLG